MKFVIKKTMVINSNEKETLENLKKLCSTECCDLCPLDKICQKDLSTNMSMAGLISDILGEVKCEN